LAHPSTIAPAATSTAKLRKTKRPAILEPPRLKGCDAGPPRPGSVVPRVACRAAGEFYSSGAGTLVASDAPVLSGGRRVSFAPRACDTDGRIARADGGPMAPAPKSRRRCARRRELDARDPLASFRERFFCDPAVPTDGNSLGPVTMRVLRSFGRWTNGSVRRREHGLRRPHRGWTMESG
jgi:hypothetical protein